MSDSTPRPDWYPDPGGSGGERYWDGSQWTAQTRAPGGGFAAPPPPQQHMPPQFTPPVTYQPTYVSPKSPGLAVLLTIVWLGAGHFYASRNDTLPIVMACLNGVFWILMSFLFIGFLFWLPAVIYMAIDASRAANAFNRRHGLHAA